MRRISLVLLPYHRKLARQILECPYQTADAGVPRPSKDGQPGLVGSRGIGCPLRQLEGQLKSCMRLATTSTRDLLGGCIKL